MGRIIEGFWYCKHCGAKIRGGIRECPHCGKARDEDTVFDFDRNNISYVSAKDAVHINRNPDWVCQYCNQLNSADDKFCVSCAAPRTEQNLNYFQNRNKKEKELEEKLLKKTQHEQQDITSNSFDSLSALSDNTDDFSDNGSNEKNFSLKNFFSAHMSHILITLFSVLGIAALIFLLIPKPQEVTIQQLSWQRSIDIERYQTVEENDWSLPSGARLLYSQEEFSHYEQVLDHYETRTEQVAKERISGYEEYVSGYRDLGNGYFEEITSSRPIYETYYETETYQDPVYRDEAVYQTKYYYEIDKWLYERSVKTEGIDKQPYWGEVVLASDERVSAEREKYSILGLTEKGKEKEISLSYEDWNSLEVGQMVKLKVSLGYGEIVE